MPNISPVILILGAGPNIGRAVGRIFASKGYKVALASRSLREEDSKENQLNIASDFANPDDIVNTFTRVKRVLGVLSVVVYNDMTIDTTSAFVAAQQAVLGFADLPPHAARTFLFTGNILNVTALPSFMGAGAGKSASAHLMMAAAAAYKDQGYKFYYVDERKADGTAIFKVDGEAHGKHFWELAEAKTQGPWLQTFVNGVGYKNFDSLYRL